jgi:hypothetical protein
MADPQNPGKLTPAERAARNHRALLLFSRGAIGTLAVISTGLGFLTGVRMGSHDYDPHTYAIGAGALCAAAFTVIAFMLYRRRIALGRMKKLEARVEELSDHNWELLCRFRDNPAAQANDVQKIAPLQAFDIAGAISASANAYRRSITHSY